MTAPTSSMSTSELTPPPQGSDPGGMARVLDLLLRVIGGVLVVACALVIGVAELMIAEWIAILTFGYLPDGVIALLPGVPLVAAAAIPVIVTHVALSHFGLRVVGNGWGIALPALAWFTLMFFANNRTAEGDFLLAGNNLVGIAMIFIGAFTFAAMGLRLILAPAATRPR